MSYTDSTTGKVIDGKAYVIKTTEGEELVDPVRLFEGPDVEALEARVAAIEAALGLDDAPPAADAPEAPQEPEAGA